MQASSARLFAACCLLPQWAHGLASWDWLSQRFLTHNAGPRTHAMATNSIPWRRSGLLRCASGGSSGLDGCATDVESVNFDGLRKEAQRVLYRSQKKLGKAQDKAAKCEAKQEALMEDESASLEDLEALPNCNELRAAADAEEEREQRLTELVAGLQAAVSAEASPAATASPTREQLVAMAAELGVNDCPPVRAPPSPPKKKGPRPSQQAPRLPYRVFLSEGGAEIRVGKQAKDNDVLSTDPRHRDGEDYWLHASGCPGSHVVIRASSLPGGGKELPREVELDAATLAANYSKAALNGNVPVSLCRARQVSKPAGAKAGLVQLSGDVKTIKVNWKIEKRRLERLASTLPEGQ
jgi:predicted ribosome quality control (RQC) complex YloA/Tae2 family protein